MKKRLFLFTFLLILISISAFSQYEIKVKLKEFPNQEIILGHHFASAIHPDDTIKLDAKGEGAFKGKTKLPGGMYLVFLPTRSYFDIFLNNDQVFSLENDTLDMINNFKSTGSLENEVFYDYQRFIKGKNNEATSLREKEKTANEQEKKKINDRMSEIGKEVNAKIEEVIKNNPDLLFAAFLKATKEIEVPTRFLDEKNQVKQELIPDYLFYFRMHFWDNFDFGDARLLRTPIYENKFKLYIEKVVPQMADTMNQVVDYLMNRVITKNAELRKDYVKPETEKEKVYNNPKANDELLRYVLITLHNHLASSQIMGMEEAFIYETYYYYTKYATWSNQPYIDKLKEDIKKKTPLFIGRTAKDLVMSKLPNNEQMVENLLKELDKVHEKGKPYSEKYKTDLKAAKGKASFKQDSIKISQEEVNNLVPLIDGFNSKLDGTKSMHSISSKYTLVWFWEESCSHCRKATPQLVEATKRIKSVGLEVYAVSLHNMTYDWDKTIKETKNWLEFVKTNKMFDWINVYDPYHFTKFRELYDINSSPVLFLLDKDKRIIAKRIGVDQVVSVLLDKELEQIFEQKQGNERIDAIKKFASNENFGLREFEMLKETLLRVLDENDKKGIEDFLNLRITAKKKVLESELKSKMKLNESERTKALEEYADSFFNLNDIDFLIEKLKENNADEATMSYFENRKKYKLE